MNNVQSEFLLNGMNRLVTAVLELSMARDLPTIISIVRSAARELTGADGASFVLREDNLVYYADEDAIGPLWKGRKFPMETCISGWTMINRQHAAIEDVFQDHRIPHDAYRPTFVKSLAMMPVRKNSPVAAIGNYWAKPHMPTDDEIQLLQALADSTSIALENVHLSIENQKALAQARQSASELSRQLELRDEFISVAAHELRTPLTPINVQSQFMQLLVQRGEFQDHARAQELQRFAEISRRQLRQLTDRVESMLDVSRIQLGQFHVHRLGGVDLNKIVEDAIQDCYQPGVELSFNSSVTVKGIWDASRISQAVRHVLRNAVKYGQNKPILITLTANLDTATLSIKDQGIGIAAEDQARIFDRFERASSYKNFGGLGLGLFITRRIIREHGGNIEVHSEAGRGTTTVIKLPL